MNVLERFIVFFLTSIIIFCTQNMNLITNKTLSIDYLSRTSDLVEKDAAYHVS